VADRLAPLVTGLLLPTFFAITGLRTSVALLDGAELWGAFGLVLLAAVVGKVGGSAGAARLAGESWRDAFALGALMNTRGLMAIVVATIGLDARVISPACFTLLILLALVTTAMTGPLLTASGAVPRAAAVPAAE
jgi:Kef-type K+ transport system membrane component KefB